jgi:hypothetical protein
MTAKPSAVPSGLALRLVTAFGAHAATHSLLPVPLKQLHDAVAASKAPFPSSELPPLDPKDPDAVSPYHGMVG